MRHKHNYEHEIYILSGRGDAWKVNGQVKIGPENVILVLPDEEHQLLNTGDEPLIFLCLIPNMK
jgi:quercetin dioxygenase-like cupin family protein